MSIFKNSRVRICVHVLSMLHIRRENGLWDCCTKSLMHSRTDDLAAPKQVRDLVWNCGCVTKKVKRVCSSMSSYLLKGLPSRAQDLRVWTVDYQGALLVSIATLQHHCWRRDLLVIFKLILGVELRMRFLKSVQEHFKHGQGEVQAVLFEHLL